jgi:flagellar basal-body rod protein FlgG
MPSEDIGYTRAGSFHPDAQGNLVTADGNPLQPTITIPPDATNISIGSDGTVTATLPGQAQASTIGSIQIATFPNPGGLNSAGDNIYLPTAASGDAIVGTPGGTDGLGTLQQNTLEDSNVSVVEQFVEMIVAQRSYESNSRVVKAADEMLQDLNQLTQ